MRNRWLGVWVLLTIIAVSGMLWPFLPDRVVTHWNAAGIADGWSSRTTAILIGPGAIAALTLVFQLLPRIDPRRANYPRFHDVYWLVANTFVLFVAVLHLAVLGAAAGARIDVLKVLAAALAVLMIVLGNFFGRIQPNWFMGIRTPWTLDHPEVWRKTHRVAAWLLVLAGVATAMSLVLPVVQPLWIAFGGAMVAALGSVVLSLIFWLKEKRA
jgi:uncharacterized membrane protein